MRLHPLPKNHSACGYFSARTANFDHYYLKEASKVELDQLLTVGYRIFGEYLFRPDCGACQNCVSLRIPLGTYHMSKSQRRIWSQGKHILVQINTPKISIEKYLLYCEHNKRFNEKPNPSFQEFERTYYKNAVCSLEFQFFLDSALLGVGYVAEGETATSSTYFYYGSVGEDYQLGTLSLLHEIAWAKSQSKQYHYLGYFVPGNTKMEYKQWFRPNEALWPEGQWKAFRGKGSSEVQKDARIFAQERVQNTETENA